MRESSALCVVTGLKYWSTNLNGGPEGGSGNNRGDASYFAGRAGSRRGCFIGQEKQEVRAGCIWRSVPRKWTACKGRVTARDIREHELIRVALNNVLPLNVTCPVSAVMFGSRRGATRKGSVLFRIEKLNRRAVGSGRSPAAL